MDEPQSPRAKRLRLLLRTLHADAGNFVVGLTFVYALSGLAVNHIADWDPNFTQVSRTHRLTLPLQHAAVAPAGDDAAAASRDQALASEILAQLKIVEKPSDVYESGVRIPDSGSRTRGR